MGRKGDGEAVVTAKKGKKGEWTKHRSIHVHVVEGRELEGGNRFKPYVKVYLNNEKKPAKFKSTRPKTKDKQPLWYDKTIFTLNDDKEIDNIEHVEVCFLVCDHRVGMRTKPQGMFKVFAKNILSEHQFVDRWFVLKDGFIGVDGTKQPIGKKAAIRLQLQFLKPGMPPPKFEKLDMTGREYADDYKEGEESDLEEQASRVAITSVSAAVTNERKRLALKELRRREALSATAISEEAVRIGGFRERIRVAEDAARRAEDEAVAAREQARAAEAERDCAVEEMNVAQEEAGHADERARDAESKRVSAEQLAEDANEARTRAEEKARDAEAARYGADEGRRLAEAARAELEAAIHQTKESAAGAQADAEEARRRADDAAAEMERARAEADERARQARIAAEEAETARAQAAESASEAQQAIKRAESAESIAERSREELERATSEAEDAKRRSKEGMTRSKEELGQISNVIAALRAELEQFRVDSECQLKEVSDAREKAETMLRRIQEGAEEASSEAEASQGALREELGRLKEQIREELDRVSQLKVQLQEANDALANKTELSEALQADVDSLCSKVETLSQELDWERQRHADLLARMEQDENSRGDLDEVQSMLSRLRARFDDMAVDLSQQAPMSPATLHHLKALSDQAGHSTWPGETSDEIINRAPKHSTRAVTSEHSPDASGHRKASFRSGVNAVMAVSPRRSGSGLPSVAPEDSPNPVTTEHSPDASGHRKASFRSGVNAVMAVSPRRSGSGLPSVAPEDSPNPVTPEHSPDASGHRKASFRSGVNAVMAVSPRRSGSDLPSVSVRAETPNAPVTNGPPSMSLNSPTQFDSHRGETALSNASSAPQHSPSDDRRAPSFRNVARASVLFKSSGSATRDLEDSRTVTGPSPDTSRPYGTDANGVQQQLNAMYTMLNTLAAAINKTNASAPSSHEAWTASPVASNEYFMANAQKPTGEIPYSPFNDENKRGSQGSPSTPEHDRFRGLSAHECRALQRLTREWGVRAVEPNGREWSRVLGYLDAWKEGWNSRHNHQRPRTIFVKRNPTNGEFRSVAEAVETANEGDCVLVGPGHYEEGHVHIHRSIMLCSNGDLTSNSGVTAIHGSLSVSALDAYIGNIRFVGPIHIEVPGTNSHSHQAPGVLVDNCDISAPDADLAMMIRGMNAALRWCLVHNSTTGVLLDDNAHHVSVVECEVSQCATAVKSSAATGTQNSIRRSTVRECSMGVVVYGGVCELSHNCFESVDKPIIVDGGEGSVRGNRVLESSQVPGVRSPIQQSPVTSADIMGHPRVTP